jgi:hypothetical protein
MKNLSIVRSSRRPASSNVEFVRPGIKRQQFARF